MVVPQANTKQPESRLVACLTFLEADPQKSPARALGSTVGQNALGLLTIRSATIDAIASAAGLWRIYTIN
jgi:hypothetical protein